MVGRFGHEGLHQLYKMHVLQLLQKVVCFTQLSNHGKLVLLYTIVKSGKLVLQFTLFWS